PHLDCTLVGDPRLDLSPHGARIVRRALAALGVRVMKTRVTEVREAGLDTDQGWLDSVLTLWAGGLRAPRWLQDAGLPLDADGRIAVDGALRVVGRPDVVAAGDCAGTRLRMACATAMPMGCHAADTLLREARGETPRPLSFGYVLRCISLGPGRALTQGTTSLDRPTWAIGGPLAAWTKASILAMVRAMPEVEARWMPGSYSWSGGPQLASAS
ncbi:MAG: FAD-dependent oxidoreductase, partial [Myxococcota bacterium]